MYLLPGLEKSLPPIDENICQVATWNRFKDKPNN